MKFAIVGSGAIGCFYGSKLANNGEEVHFLFHTEYEDVKKKGLTVISYEGDIRIDSPLLYNSTKSMPVVDCVIVAIKSTVNNKLPEMLRPIVGQNTVIILIQNGLGGEELLKNMFPNNQIVAGMAFICSSRIEPGVIQHFDYGRLTLGFCPLNKNFNNDRVKLEDVFVRSGIDVVFTDDWMTARWKKLVWNIPFNGLSVLLDKNTGEILSCEEGRSMSRKMMNEVIDAAEACGVFIDKSFANEMIDFTLNMKPYYPSMFLDYQYKRPLEIEYIYQNPADYAAKFGFDMKLTKFVAEMLTVKTKL